MNNPAQWLIDLKADSKASIVDGLVPVNGYIKDERPFEEVAMMEKAKYYGAHSVFFEAGRNGRPPIAQAFIYVEDGRNDDEFADLHKRLWSWGGVPLVYRKTPGLIQLFRCAHEPDFDDNGTTVYKPHKTLEIAGRISERTEWWDAFRLRNGTLWDVPDVCNELLDAKKSAYKRLFNAFKQLNDDLNRANILEESLRRKLLILSLLIAYLEERDVLRPDYYDQFLPGATNFFQILKNGNALAALLENLEERFNGNVFVLNDTDRKSLGSNKELVRYADFVEGCKEKGGQQTLWQLYSFKDLPVELISNIYQLFVNDSSSSVYTPPFLVRLILEEALSWERIDRLIKKQEVILDPCCGSGVFLVEAYKRLVLHWRSCNQWDMPRTNDLKKLLNFVHGIDLEEGAIELAAFSLYLALCDALEPETIRKSVKLFPVLMDKTLHNTCFFDAKEQQLIKQPVGVVIGNPPFKNRLDTPGAKCSYKKFNENHDKLPDKQLSFLFLHEAMGLLAEGGILSMLQQYSFLYNQQAIKFRQTFMNMWDVREILDFISVGGLFRKAVVQTKVIVVVAEATRPTEDRMILHAIFRRSGRIDAEQGFDIDYYDMHWLPRKFVLINDNIWRSDLFGGGRIFGLVDRLKKLRSLVSYAKEHRWCYGEGFFFGNPNDSRDASHVVGKPFLPREALDSNGIDESKITYVPDKPIHRPRCKEQYSPPILLIGSHIDLPHDLWMKYYLTYPKRIVGFSAPEQDITKLRKVDTWLSDEQEILKAFIVLTSPSLFTQRETALLPSDIYSLPYPKSKSFNLNCNDQILIDDIVHYYIDLIRLGNKSPVMKESGFSVLNDFTNVFTHRINAIYKNNPLQILEPQTWPGIICQPFAFGEGKVDWDGTDELKEKLNSLLKENRNTSIHITRIARIYDGNFIFMLKPDRLRFWLRSVALRDADETLADMREQGF